MACSIFGDHGIPQLNRIKLANCIGRAGKKAGRLIKTLWREILREGLQPEPAEQRSDFEALVQACEELGVEHEARTGHKAVQHVKIRRGSTR